MKKIIACIIIVITIFCLVSCTETEKDEHGNEVYVFAPFTEISHTDGVDASGSSFTTYLIYDNSTKIIYYFIDGYHSHALSEYYVIDENGYCHMCKYENGEIIPLPIS